jgi:hypothetical protein
MQMKLFKEQPGRFYEDPGAGLLNFPSLRKL